MKITDVTSKAVSLPETTATKAAAKTRAGARLAPGEGGGGHGLGRAGRTSPLFPAPQVRGGQSPPSSSGNVVESAADKAAGAGGTRPADFTLKNFTDKAV